MTQEEKELLLEDLCARIPCGIKVNRNGDVYDVLGYTMGSVIIVEPFMSVAVGVEIEEIKPYLRPMWSMTNEEQKEFVGFHCVNLCPIIMDEMLTLENETKMFDWLNARHFDYRGLIGKGLALEAPEGMYEN